RSCAPGAAHRVPGWRGTSGSWLGAADGEESGPPGRRHGGKGHGENILVELPWPQVVARSIVPNASAPAGGARSRPPVDRHDEAVSRAKKAGGTVRGLLLAPGAGAGSDQSSLVAIDEAVTGLGVTVERVDFPYRLAGRSRPDQPAVLEATITSAAESLAGRLGAPTS